jgi:CRISPR/Cas system-associated protein endoribonuclease Cas2
MTLLTWLAFQRSTQLLCHTVTPDFKAKPNAHSMCAQESRFHTYLIENGYRITNITIYNIYYANNVFNKRLNQTLSKHNSEKTP